MGWFRGSVSKASVAAVARCSRSRLGELVLMLFESGVVGLVVGFRVLGPCRAFPGAL